MRFISKNQTGFDVKFPKLDICKYFSASKDGWDVALTKAKAYRDEVEEKTNYFNPEYRAHKRARGTRHLTNSVAGIYLAVQKRGNSVRANFIVYYKDEGYFRKKSFGVRKYGYVDAFNRALAFRTEKAGSVNTEGAVLPAPTTAQFLLIKDLADDIPSPKA